MHMAQATKPWTLEELHRLPDDGNKYELVHGDLFVTPPPSYGHETILAKLTRVVDPYVAAQSLGLVYHARSVVRLEGSEVEPDLMVRPAPPPETDWDNAPKPLLIVEVLSGSTRRRDHGPKRDFYLTDVGVSEYWIIDPEAKSVRVVKPGAADELHADELSWWPSAASHSLTIAVPELF